MKGVHWTIICFCIFKMPQIASLAVSARTTFEAIVQAWLGLDLFHVAFDMCSSGGVVDRNSVPEMSQRIRRCKPLVVVDPMQPGWNLCGRVTQKILNDIANGMRAGWGQYWAKPSEYWKQQLRNLPEPLVEPTSYDRSMAEAHISELRPWPGQVAASATSQAAASAAMPPATKPAVASAAVAPQPSPRPEYIMPFNIGDNIVVLREQETRNVLVRLFTCRWDGTPGYSEQFTLSIPRDLREGGKLPLIMVLPGADDRRLCAAGAESKLNKQAQAAFKSAVVIECNAAVMKKGPAWVYHPQPWMAELALYMKCACATHLVGIGYGRGTSWLIQLVAQRPGIFDKIVLLAPYPPPDMDDAICGQAIASSFANLQNILVVGSNTDECLCTEKAHPQFWQLLAKRGMPSWIKMEVGHGQFEGGVWRLQEEQWAQVQSIVFSFMLRAPDA